MTAASLFIPDTHAGAEFSECGTWRYRLWRRWDTALPIWVWLMCNASTADGSKLDATTRKVTRFTRDFGGGGWVVVNMFGLVATDPRELRAFEGDRVGPENDAAIRNACLPAEFVLVAWGRVGGVYEERVKHVVGMVEQCNLWCLGLTKDGHPRHPLTLPYSTSLEPWEAAE